MFLFRMAVRTLQGSLIQELTRGSWATNPHAIQPLSTHVTKNNRGPQRRSTQQLMMRTSTNTNCKSY